MSKQSKASKSKSSSTAAAVSAAATASSSSPEYNAALSQFMGVTGASAKEAARFLHRHGGRVDVAVDAYFAEQQSTTTTTTSTTMTTTTMTTTTTTTNNSAAHHHHYYQGGGMGHGHGPAYNNFTYNPTYNPALAPAASAATQAARLNALFDRYRSADAEDDAAAAAAEPDTIAVEGTLRLCADLGVDPERDVALLAVACELRAPAVGAFSRGGWRDGWRALGVDSLAGMRNALPRLRSALATEWAYFRRVYLFTFDFARAEGQRSLATDTAQAFWALLIPHGVHGGALAHVEEGEEGEGYEGEGETRGAAAVVGGEGWTDEHTQWWFDFLNEKGTKGVSRDTWNMFISFVRTIDPRFEKHDLEAAWPSTIDEFVEWAKEHRVPR